MRVRGFTLIELLTVIAITGILAAVLTVFLRPAIDSYLDTRRRANLTDIADTALRRMGQDIRSAVPNSIRTNGTESCFQLVPTITGGRYRMAYDVSGASRVGAPLDVTAATTSFDVLSPMSTVPSGNNGGDWVVINNQNTNDVYAGINTARISSVVAYPPVLSGIAQYLVTLTAPKQFSSGYDGGRFQVVSSAAPTIVYSYAAATRTLYRAVTTFSTAFPSALCGTGAIVATNVSGAQFIYVPNKGATQQSGFLQMRLTLEDAAETVTLVHGVHVENSP